MQVSVEEVTSIARKISLVIPARKISDLVNAKLKEVSKNIKLNGFRPGHVPVKLIKEKYGFSLYQEVVNEILDSSLNKALTEHKLEPIGDINLQEIDNSNFTNEEFDFENIKDVNCTFSLEVYPEVQFNNFADLTIKAPAVNITPEDIDKSLLEARKTFGVTAMVARPAKDGDILTVDYKGTIDEQEFAGGTGNDLKVEIGSGSFINGFESGLIGCKVNDQITLNLKFPEEYAEQSLAGKPVVFNINVKKIEEKQLAELDEKFAKFIKVPDGDVNKIHEIIKENLEKKLEKLIKEKEYKAVTDLLLNNYPIELSTQLINSELDHLKFTFKRHNQEQGINIENLNHKTINELEEQAKKNVHLSILLRSIVKQNNLTVDKKLLQEKLYEFDKYFKNVNDYKKMRVHFQNSIINSNLTNMALDFVLGKVSKNSEHLSVEELMAPDQNNNFS